nr:IclR family transcriptional regulator [uncultured Anaeromusa sp.]
MSQQPAVVKSAARALELLEYVVNAPKAPTFRVLQDTLDIPKSSLSYLLQELAGREYLQYDSERRVYSPGLKLIRLSASCINNTDMSQEIWQGIKGLSEEFGETTHAGILDGRHIIYISKCEGKKDVSIVPTIGYRIPAHATAIGKVLLADLSSEELEGRLQNVVLEKYTEQTITNYAHLAKELRQVRQNGYAFDNQEIIVGGVCLAAPVYDKHRKVIAAVSLTMPVLQTEEPLFQKALVRVKEVANYISMRIGKI